MVLHTFMFAILDSMGYPQVLTDWIRLIYAKSFAIVRHKGWFTEEFPIK